jgi:hypothetical protein
MEDRRNFLVWRGYASHNPERMIDVRLPGFVELAGVSLRGEGNSVV